MLKLKTNYSKRHMATSPPPGAPFLCRQTYLIIITTFWSNSRPPLLWTSLQDAMKNTENTAATCHRAKGRLIKYLRCVFTRLTHWIWQGVTYGSSRNHNDHEMFMFRSIQDMEAAATAQLKTLRSEGFQSCFRGWQNKEISVLKAGGVL